jgi:hypothetical protein
VLGKIAILASEQRWLDEANGAEVVSEGTDGSGMKDDKPKEGGGRPRVLADGTYAIETAYVTTRARLEAVKAAGKPPLRSGFGMFLLRNELCPDGSLVPNSHLSGWRLLYRRCACYYSYQTRPVVR